MKSFEEFHTSQKRQRAWQEAIMKEKQEKIMSIKTTTTKHNENQSVQGAKQKADDESKALSRHKIGQTLEAVETQLFIVIMIYLDLVASTIIYVLENDVGTFTNTAKIEPLVDNDSIILRLLTSLTSFTTICFVIELCGLIYAFGINFFSHHGYCIDMSIIVVCIGNNMYNTGLDLIFPLAFLGFLRFWRIARLVSMMISNVERKNDVTKSMLMQTEMQLKTKTMQYNRLDASLRNEVDLRKQVEKALLSYKDEIETLKEALKIAAMDVAMAAKDDIATLAMDTIGEDDEDESNVDKIVDVDDGNDDGDEFFDGNEKHDEDLVVIKNDDDDDDNDDDTRSFQG